MGALQATNTASPRGPNSDHDKPAARPRPQPARPRQQPQQPAHTEQQVNTSKPLRPPQARAPAAELAAPFKNASSSRQQLEASSSGTLQPPTLPGPAFKSTRLRVNLEGIDVPQGVQLQKFCARLMAPPSTPSIPRLDALILVEGFNDCLAVHRAVRAPVFLLLGGNALDERMGPELALLRALCEAGRLPRTLVVMTDPDWQGRQLRTMLDDALGGGASAGAGAGQPQQGQQQQEGSGAAVAIMLRQAFLRVELGTSTQDTEHHEEGNVGVEHARPDSIRACLRAARPSFGAGRCEFSQEELQQAGLVGSWNKEKDAAQVRAPKMRRAAFCAALGIDEVSRGKALLNMLNRFFTRQEYECALAAACRAFPDGAAEAPAAAGAAAAAPAASD